METDPVDKYGMEHNTTLDRLNAMLNYESSPEEIAVVINTLPELSRKVYDVIIKGLYAEPGFSDLTWSAIATSAGITHQQISGVAKKLIETGLVYDEPYEGFDLDTEFNNNYVFVHALVHDRGF